MYRYNFLILTIEKHMFYSCSLSPHTQVLLVILLFLKLLRGEGLLQNGSEGQVKFYPYKKRGGVEKVFAMLKGGTQSFEVVLNMGA